MQIPSTDKSHFLLLSDIKLIQIPQNAICLLNIFLKYFKNMLFYILHNHKITRQNYQPSTQSVQKSKLKIPIMSVAKQ